MSDNNWPDKRTFQFRNGRGDILEEESEVDLDIAALLMPSWPHNQRTIYLHLKTDSRKKMWKNWNFENVEVAERLVRNDLAFDGHRTIIKRLSNVGFRCTQPFIWKILIRW
jgi:predicted RNA-binding protein (virulence factor B family)